MFSSMHIIGEYYISLRSRMIGSEEKEKYVLVTCTFIICKNYCLLLFIFSTAVQIIELNKFMNMFSSMHIIRKYHISLCLSMFGGEETYNICSCDWAVIICKNYYLVLLFIFTTAVQIIELNKFVNMLSSMHIIGEYYISLCSSIGVKLKRD